MHVSTLINGVNILPNLITKYFFPSLAPHSDLKNAGFNFVDSDDFEMHIYTDAYRIYIEPEYGGKMIVYKLDDSCGFEVLHTTIQDSNDVSKKCYPFLGYELDFSEKEKSYAWEDCIGKEGWWVNSGGEIYPANTELDVDISRNIFKEEEQAEQSLALSQLSWIIPEIDKDYPREVDYDYVSRVLWIRGEFTFGEVLAEYSSEYIVSAQSVEGAKILIKNHPQLLKKALLIKE